MAMNVGRRPSIEDGTDMTVEVHILHRFQSSNFRGQRLRVIGTGYIRQASLLPPAAVLSQQQSANSHRQLQVHMDCCAQDFPRAAQS